MIADGIPKSHFPYLRKRYPEKRQARRLRPRMDQRPGLPRSWRNWGSSGRSKNRTRQRITNRLQPRPPRRKGFDYVLLPQHEHGRPLPPAIHRRAFAPSTYTPNGVAPITAANAGAGNFTGFAPRMAGANTLTAPSFSGANPVTAPAPPRFTRTPMIGGDQPQDQAATGTARSTPDKR